MGNLCGTYGWDRWKLQQTHIWDSCYPRPVVLDDTSFILLASHNCMGVFCSDLPEPYPDWLRTCITPKEWRDLVWELTCKVIDVKSKVGWSTAPQDFSKILPRQSAVASAHVAKIAPHWAARGLRVSYYEGKVKDIHARGGTICADMHNCLVFSPMSAEISAQQAAEFEAITAKINNLVSCDVKPADVSDAVNGKGLTRRQRFMAMLAARSEVSTLAERTGALALPISSNEPQSPTAAAVATAVVLTAQSETLPRSVNQTHAMPSVYVPVFATNPRNTVTAAADADSSWALDRSQHSETQWHPPVGIHLAPQLPPHSMLFSQLTPDNNSVMNFCSNCGLRISSVSSQRPRFCVQCGNAFS